MLEFKDFRTPDQLKEDGFNQQEIRDMEKRRGTYIALCDEMEEANKEKDYERVVELEEEIKQLEYVLLYRGKNPKELPLSVIKELAHTVSDHDVFVGLQPARKRIKNPATAIRAQCLDCMGGSALYVRECEAMWCELWPFRLGTNPFRGKVIPPLKQQIEVEPDEAEFDEDEGDDDDAG